MRHVPVLAEERWAGGADDQVRLLEFGLVAQRDVRLRARRARLRDARAGREVAEVLLGEREESLVRQVARRRDD